MWVFIFFPIDPFKSLSWLVCRATLKFLRLVPRREMQFLLLTAILITTFVCEKKKKKHQLRNDCKTSVRKTRRGWNEYVSCVSRRLLTLSFMHICPTFAKTAKNNRLKEQYSLMNYTESSLFLYQGGSLLAKRLKLQIKMTKITKGY